MTDAKKKLIKQEFILVHDGKCFYCGKEFSSPTDPDMTIDHIIPKAIGGTDSSENLVPCCLKCNQEKSCYLPSEWVRRIKYKLKEVEANIKRRKKMVKKIEQLFDMEAEI